MEPIKKILFLSSHNAAATRQAVFYANAMQAELTSLAVVPMLGDEKQRHDIISKMQENCRLQAEKLNANELNIHYDVLETDQAPAIEIIRQVLRDGYQLVIKAADVDEAHTAAGFLSIDMQLLRKCPCPLLLCREKAALPRRIAVAIDPEDKEGAGKQLTDDLLELTGTIAGLHQIKPRVFTCWFSKVEGRIGNPFVQLNTKAAQEGAAHDKQEQFKTLQALVEGKRLSADLHHQKGSPNWLIPHMAKQQEIDLLIMGTVARTGIPGFIIGNTAETILSRIECSVLAIKPRGFVSPVTL